MNKKLSSLLLFRRVFMLAGEGKGLATSLVETFRGEGSEGKGVARKILLGFPVQAALEPLSSQGTEELSVLANLLANSSSSSARLIGRKGQRLSFMFERWMKMKEARQMQQRVMQLRSHLMAAVMGAVVAMLASLGPLVAGLNFLSPSPEVSGSSLLLWSGVMVGTSSTALGLFMAGRRFYVDTLIALLAFGLTAAATAPLASVPVVGLWGIK